MTPVRTLAFRSSQRILLSGLVCSSLAFLSPGAALAQTSTGGLRGIVRDSGGGVLAGVTVEATSPARIGAPAVDVTNDQGLYRFEGLPVGVYSLSFTLQGFKTVKREGVRVEVGRSIELPVSLEIGQLEESVTVTGDSPVVDAVNAGLATTFNQELISNIPSARASYFDLVTYAPAVKTNAVTNDVRFTVFGSNLDQNAFQYDGVDVSAPSYGSPWDFPSFEIIQEVEVKAIGASAEQFGFQGGVMNIVTKSGSNTVKGAVNFFFVDSSFVGNNTPKETFPYHVDYSQQFTAQMGGPIKKDKLWVIGVVEATRNRNTQVGVDPATAPRRHVLRPFFKVNNQLSPRNYLEFMFTDNNFTSPDQPSRTAPAETVSVEHGHNPVISARWNHQVGRSSMFEVKGGGIYIRDRFDPYSDNFTTSGHFDLSTGVASGNAASVTRVDQNKTQLSATMSHFADNFIKGSHDLKFGVQLVNSRADVSSAYIKNFFYYDLGGRPYYALTKDPGVRTGRVRESGVFLQDNWSVNDRLTANIGVRFDHSLGDIPTSSQFDDQGRTKTGVTFPGVADLISYNNPAVRLGLTYKVDTAGKTVAKASFGRYYGRLLVNMFRDISPGNPTTSAFFYNASTGKYDIPYFSNDPNANYDVDPNLKNQYTEQLFVGVEREILPDFGVNVFYVKKREADFVRIRDVRGVYAPREITDTFRGASQTLTVFNRTSPSSQSLFQVTNRNDFDQSYDAFVLEANKRFSRNWQVNGSYVWQRSKGYASGSLAISSQDFSNIGINAFGRDPNDLTNAFGRLPADSTHSVKMSGATHLPFQINLGLRYSYESGRPYGRVITVRGLGQGSRTVIAQPRGSYALPALNDLQVRVDRDVRFANKRLNLSLDIFNLFNKDTFYNVRNNSSQGEALFGQSLSIISPRRATVGLRFQF